MAEVSPHNLPLTRGQTLKVRNARREDAAALLAMANSILAEQIYSLLEPGELNFTLEQEIEWIEKMNAHPNHLLLVAEVNGEIIGMLDFTAGHRKRIAHTGEFGISVAQGFRNQGVGRKLLETLLTWAKAHAVIEKISLKVHANNEHAIHVYEKLGFKTEARLKGELKYSETEYVDTLLMSLLL